MAAINKNLFDDRASDRSTGFEYFKSSEKDQNFIVSKSFPFYIGRILSFDIKETMEDFIKTTSSRHDRVPDYCILIIPHSSLSGSFRMSPAVKDVTLEMTRYYKDFIIDSDPEAFSTYALK